ncbi:TonB-dependent receptor, partial [Acinetobacter baumannii]|nr:TonB-dependent receptor [Acinetobacter baumannii]
EHEHGGPWIDLKSERYDFKTELNDPFAGFQKLRAQASYTDYQHDEIEEGTIATRFQNKGYDGRIELVHNPIADWEGVIGTQLGQQKLNLTGEEAFMAPTTTKKWSVFA